MIYQSEFYFRIIIPQAKICHTRKHLVTLASGHLQVKSAPVVVLESATDLVAIAPLWLAFHLVDCQVVQAVLVMVPNLDCHGLGF